MPIPSDAATWLDAMDPADLIDYEANMEPLLETAESINTFTVALMPEAVLLGVQIATGIVDGGNRDPVKVAGTGGATIGDGSYRVKPGDTFSVSVPEPRLPSP